MKNAKEHELTVGDRVAFSRAFLRSCAMYTGWQPFARGVVTSLTDLGSITLADIKWSHHARAEADQPAMSRINTRNLVLESRIHLEPA